MRKRVISPAPKELTSPDPKWLDVEQLARVEVTSEDAASAPTRVRPSGHHA
jgi:hypothetical protein